MYAIFSQAVLSTPDATAIVLHNGKQYTYASAAEYVHQWAHYLLQQGIQAHDRVGVLLDDEDQHVFILLALERIHAQYVPFDTDIPPQQFFNDLQTAQVKKCIVETSLLSTFSVDPSLLIAYSTSVAAEITEQPKTQPSVVYDSQDPNKIVYLVSSSGSTGNKKWIPIGNSPYAVSID